jgi:hypothetical protein
MIPMLEQLQDFVNNLPEIIQWAGVILVSAIPFVESYGGAMIGIIAGVSPFIAIPAAIIGNVISMLAFIFFGSSVRSLSKGGEEKPPSKRMLKLRSIFDKYGVPAVSIFGPLVIASQLSAAAMVSFGASRIRVIIWGIIGVSFWGIFSGLFMYAIITLI